MADSGPAGAGRSVVVMMMVSAVLDDPLAHVIVVAMMTADAHMIMIAVRLDLDVLMPLMQPWTILMVLGRGDDGEQAYSDRQGRDDMILHGRAFQRSDLSMSSPCRSSAESRGRPTDGRLPGRSAAASVPSTQQRHPEIAESAAQ